MANRKNDDDKNGRKNQRFNIDSQAFGSDDDFVIDDDYDFSIDDDMFVNSSQKKKQGGFYFHALYFK
jgi:hypothetical protein